jgi:hypothetical protein
MTLLNAQEKVSVIAATPIIVQRISKGAANKKPIDFLRRREMLVMG